MEGKNIHSKQGFYAWNSAELEDYLVGLGWFLPENSHDDRFERFDILLASQTGRIWGYNSTLLKDKKILSLEDAKKFASEVLCKKD